MRNDDRAFEFDDLTLLLGLDLTDPADLIDIEAIDAILARRRDAIPIRDHRHRNRPTLRLVPDVSS
jgi:hypothetical protein